jgi:hypothetical protein
MGLFYPFSNFGDCTILKDLVHRNPNIGPPILVTRKQHWAKLMGQNEVLLGTYLGTH